MKVTNMLSAQGNKVPNQFIIGGHDHFGSAEHQPMLTVKTETFQSYGTVIAKKQHFHDGLVITLDSNAWDYSKTTGCYRNQFLNETKKETQAKINSGEYLLADLNKGEG